MLFLFSIFAALDGLPDPSGFSSIGWILVCLAALALAVNQILTLTDRWKENPPGHLQYATKEELRELKQQTDRDRKTVAELSIDITERFDALDVKRESSIRGLHDAVTSAVKELRTEIREDFKGFNIRLTEALTAIAREQGKNSK